MTTDSRERVDIAYSSCAVHLTDGQAFVGRLEVRGDLRRLWFVAEDGSGAEFRADLSDGPPTVARIEPRGSR